MKKRLLFIITLSLLASQPGRTQTEEELWKKYILDPTEENVKQFIAYFPTSPLMPELELKVWGLCKSGGRKKDCDVYIRYFPTGEHLAEANEIKSRASDVEIIVDGAVDALDEIVDIIVQDDDNSDAEADNREEAENQTSQDLGETEPSSTPTAANRNETPSRPGTPTKLAKPKSTKPGSAKPNPAKPAATRPVQIDKVWAEHNVVRDNRKGMFVHLNFKAAGLTGKPCMVKVCFLNASGKSLMDSNRKYANSQGKVVSVRKFAPKTTTVQYSDFKVFMPYGELHQKGKNKILYYVKIQSGKTVYVKSKPRSFNLTWR